MSGIWNVSHGGTKFTFLPDQPLVNGEEYKISITANVKNEAGVSLKKEKTVKFKVAENNSDFAIVTPSVTLNEIYFMELPFLAIMTAPNQIDVYEYIKLNKHLVLKEFNHFKLYKKLIKVLK